MKISLNWIKDFAKLEDNLNPFEVMERFTMSSAEVEEFEVIGKCFEQIKTAKVEKIKPHPDADKLQLVTLDDGLGAIEVVCGARNVALDQIVALARVGTELPAGTLKPAKIRGVHSEGMILAEDELGLSDAHEGIMVFPPDTKIGMTLDKIFGGTDIVLDVDNKSLTHRPDLWGHIGIAREFAAIYETEFTQSVDEKQAKLGTDKIDPLQIDNQVPNVCPRYSALAISNLTVMESPKWMQQRLRNVDIRPINNLVDVTNYVMMEFGQPMHAFDRRHISHDKIIIRMASDGEKFTSLDEQERTLSSTDLVITDSEKVLALGGVMGGLNSEILDDTNAVILESANFNATCIRRTSVSQQLRTDSSKRFEKSQDPQNTYPAIIRAVELIKLTCPDAVVSSHLLDSFPVKPKKHEIEIDFDFIHSRLGETLPEKLIIKILTNLQFDVQMIKEGTMKIGIPSYRATKDLSIKADIVEEIGRIYGYDNIIPKAPTILSNPTEINEQRRFEWQLRDIFCMRLGFDEVCNPSFISAKNMENCGFDPESCLHLKNAIVQDEDCMRNTLFPHAILNIATNQKNFENFRFFEIGRETIKKDRSSSELATETRRLVGTIYEEESEQFYLAKGAVTEALHALRVPDVTFSKIEKGQKTPAWVHPARFAKIYSGKTKIGLVAELHPAIGEKYELKKRAAIFRLDLDTIFLIDRKIKDFVAISKYPLNRIEITVVVDTNSEVYEIEKVIKKSAGEYFAKSHFMYIYEGEKIKPGKKAVTYHVEFGASDRTLGKKEVAKLHKNLVLELSKNNMPIRGEE